MDSERSTKIKIGENEYSLVLTTKATKEIAARYGGLENLGDKLMKSENFEMALDEVIWLITLIVQTKTTLNRFVTDTRKRTHHHTKISQIY